MKKTNILITGGAGYLGRCTAEIFSREGFSPILVDNFSTSSPPQRCPFPILTGDLEDKVQAERIFSEAGEIQAIIHFAARALVPESYESPELYYRNNLLCTLNIAELAGERGVRYIVHSSSCAVYGVPLKTPIPESAPLLPISPYGQTKVMSEAILNDVARRRELKVLNLRFFNPAGALEGARFGEAHTPETHLIPNVVAGFLEGNPVIIHGDRHPTDDGTCIRDFIHVADLAQAHVEALRLLEQDCGTIPLAMNLGAGKGSSIREVIATAEKVLKGRIPVKIGPQRTGDPPVLVADTTLAQKTLGWSPRLGLEEMITSHYRWKKGL